MRKIAHVSQCLNCCSPQKDHPVKVDHPWEISPENNPGKPHGKPVFDVHPEGLMTIPQ